MPAYDSQTVDGTFFVDNGFKHNHSLNASLERQWWIRRHGATNHIALLNALADADRLIVRYKGWFGLGGFWWRSFTPRTRPPPARAEILSFAKSLYFVNRSGAGESFKQSGKFSAVCATNSCSPMTKPWPPR